MPTLISLFSGGGGMDCGLEAAGFESRFCTDIDWHSCVTLRYMRRQAHRGKPGGLRNAAILRTDITQLQPETILAKARLAAGEADVLAGGPPCQSFSVFGRRQGLNDPRGLLVWQYLRILHGVRPRVFLFENVAGLLTIDGGRVFEQFLRDVQEPFGDQQQYQYTVQYYAVEAANYGVPQYRARIIVIGTLNNHNLPVPPKDAPFVTHGVQGKRRGEKLLLPYNTAADALQELPPIGATTAPRNHVGRVHSQPIIERYHRLAFGERDPHTRINRLNPIRPSYTIIVGSDQGGGKGHVHPHEAREVTPRESARMQSFPDWWGFSGTSRHPIRQIGNAVPPILAAALGSFVREHIFGEVPRTREEMWTDLGQQHLLRAEAARQIEQIPNPQPYGYVLQSPLALEV